MQERTSRCGGAEAKRSSSYLSARCQGNLGWQRESSSLGVARGRGLESRRPPPSLANRSRYFGAGPTIAAYRPFTASGMSDCPKIFHVNVAVVLVPVGSRR